MNKEFFLNTFFLVVKQNPYAVALIIAAILLPFALLYLYKKNNQLKSSAKKPLKNIQTSESETPKQEMPQSLSLALSKTKKGFITNLLQTFSKSNSLTDEMMEQIESSLFTADIGVATAQELLDSVQKKYSSAKWSEVAEIEKFLKEKMLEILAKANHKTIDVTDKKPHVILVLGVNGAGKTTTIGKLAAKMQKNGSSVLLGAGDTFRAAASEQLDIWAGKNNCEIIIGKPKQDPASVLFQAVQAGKEKNADVVICDTAGRLHTKSDLMAQLGKVHKVVGKALPGAPHEILLVLDANTGQNAIMQAKEFAQVMPISGIILTKLDGTAKGGIVLGIVNELKIPIRYIGVGEKIDDLKPFNDKEFVEALFAK